MAYEFARGGKPLRPPVLERGDGSLTGNLQEMDTMLLEAWEPTFSMYSTTEPPSVAAFTERYRAHLPSRTELPLGNIQPDDLRYALKRMSADTAFGAEGWRRDELLRLPDSIIALLCKFI